jgi:hypothetical protein
MIASPLNVTCKCGRKNVRHASFLCSIITETTVTWISNTLLILQWQWVPSSSGGWKYNPGTQQRVICAPQLKASQRGQRVNMKMAVFLEQRVHMFVAPNFTHNSQVSWSLNRKATTSIPVMKWTDYYYYFTTFSKLHFGLWTTAT